APATGGATCRTCTRPKRFASYPAMRTAPPAGCGTWRWRAAPGPRSQRLGLRSTSLLANGERDGAVLSAPLDDDTRRTSGEPAQQLGCLAGAADRHAVDLYDDVALRESDGACDVGQLHDQCAALARQAAFGADRRRNRHELEIAQCTHALCSERRQRTRSDCDLSLTAATPRHELQRLADVRVEQARFPVERRRDATTIRTDDRITRTQTGLFGGRAGCNARDADIA